MENNKSSKGGSKTSNFDLSNSEEIINLSFSSNDANVNEESISAGEISKIDSTEMVEELNPSNTIEEDDTSANCDESFLNININQKNDYQINDSSSLAENNNSQEINSGNNPELINQDTQQSKPKKRNKKPISQKTDKEKSDDADVLLTNEETRKAVIIDIEEKLLREKDRLQKEMDEKFESITLKENEKLIKLEKIIPIVYKTNVLNASIEDIENVLKKLADRVNGVKKLRNKTQTEDGGKK
jgi:hypothetical protein